MNLTKIILILRIIIIIEIITVIICNYNSFESMSCETKTYSFVVFISHDVLILSLQWMICTHRLHKLGTRCTNLKMYQSGTRCTNLKMYQTWHKMYQSEVILVESGDQGAGYFEKCGSKLDVPKFTLGISDF